MAAAKVLGEETPPTARPDAPTAPETTQGAEE